MSNDCKPAAPPSRWERKLALGAGLAVAAGVCAAIVVAFGRPAGPGQFGQYACSELRGYALAQGQYRKARCGGKDEYARELPLLSCTRDAEGWPVRAICLIDAHFADAWGPEGRPHAGHLFQEPRTVAGQPIDWEKDFALCSTPAEYGRTGVWTFVVRTDGRVWGKDLGSSAFVTDFPADPGKAGWACFE